jgi:2'-5' RNA ligase
MEKSARVNYPLIITLEMDSEHKAMFNALRKAHFPAHSNYLDAHLTLFHHLPSREPIIEDTLKAFSNREQLMVEVSAVKSIGNGVIFCIASEELQVLHQSMQQILMPWLKRQDQQALRPHITVQNKVTEFKATRLQEELQSAFTPFTITVTGFSTWYYLGGPWRPAGFFPFSNPVNQ